MFHHKRVCCILLSSFFISKLKEKDEIFFIKYNFKYYCSCEYKNVNSYSFPNIDYFKFIFLYKIYINFVFLPIVMCNIPPLENSNSVENAAKTLNDSNATITMKMRALFHLRNIISDESANTIKKYLYKTNSILLQHEMCYVLGQMRLECSKSILIEIVENEKINEVTRHEAAEALANFNDTKVIEILKKYITHPSIPLRETCYIAIKKLEERNMLSQKQRLCNINLEEQSTMQDDLNNLVEEELSKFDSRDPAIPLFTEYTQSNIQEAGDILNDENECLYRKYKAMFFLRDCVSDEAHDLLINKFNDKSSLFKHELAFIMGQMRLEKAVENLNRIINDENEHGMVRHEAAEALGAIGTGKCKEYLYKQLHSKCDILRESVEVALDIWDYENNKELDYAVAQ